MTRGRLHLSKNGLVWELNETVSVPPKRKHLVSAQPPEGSGATHKVSVPSVQIGMQHHPISEFYLQLGILKLKSNICSKQMDCNLIICHLFPLSVLFCCLLQRISSFTPAPGRAAGSHSDPSDTQGTAWLLWHWHWQGVFVPLFTINWSCASYKQQSFISFTALANLAFPSVLRSGHSLGSHISLIIPLWPWVARAGGSRCEQVGVQELYLGLQSCSLAFAKSTEVSVFQTFI